MPNLSANPGASVLSATRSELSIQKPTTVEVSLQTVTRLLNGSVLHVYFSSLLLDV